MHVMHMTIYAFSDGLTPIFVLIMKLVIMHVYIILAHNGPTT